ncbi:MAG TPA: hypothetical protein PLS50_07130, partial [Candidatus Dojkabacteria bacterium]|nr:hypothetical protein [Candidatus Dojkabacteria bacterium]
FVVNKDLYYAGLTYLRINFGPITKVCYLSTSNNNPSAGTKVTYPLATARIENLKLMLAIEKNESIARNVINQVMTNGIRLLIPYVLTFKNTGNSQTQNINIPLDAGQGITLMKVIHALYNQTEDVDLAYDHANTALNQKIFEYYTSFKSTRLQQLNLVWALSRLYAT